MDLRRGKKEEGREKKEEGREKKEEGRGKSCQVLATTTCDLATSALQCL
jgi:hypothetical protein